MILSFDFMLINTLDITVLNCIVNLLHYHFPQDPIIWGSTAQRNGDRIVRAPWPTSSDAALWQTTWGFIAQKQLLSAAHNIYNN